MSKFPLLLILVLGTAQPVAGPSPPALQAERVLLLGRCPVDSVSEIIAGGFVSRGEQLLFAEPLGIINCQTAGTRTKVPVYRLVLLNRTERGFERLWQSQLLLGREAVAASLVPDIWTFGDIDSDSLLEVIMIKGNSISLFHFCPEAFSSLELPFTAAVTIDAVCADIEMDGFMELVTLEQKPDSTGKRVVIRVWQIIGNELKQRGKTIELPDLGQEIKFSFLGSAKLEDYPGAPVLVLGEYLSLRPSRYYALYLAGDSFVLTGIPFPWQEWFSKDEVLPAGRLQLFNVGDTLVAYGYFVPGVRAGISAGSFAALQDGEWRVLQLKEWAKKLVGPFYQFGSNWLTLHNQHFYLLAEEPFYWR